MNGHKGRTNPHGENADDNSVRAAFLSRGRTRSWPRLCLTPRGLRLTAKSAEKHKEKTSPSLRSLRSLLLSPGSLVVARGAAVWRLALRLFRLMLRDTPA